MQVWAAGVGISNTQKNNIMLSLLFFNQCGYSMLATIHVWCPCVPETGTCQKIHTYTFERTLLYRPSVVQLPSQCSTHINSWFLYLYISFSIIQKFEQDQTEHHCTHDRKIHPTQCSTCSNLGGSQYMAGGSQNITCTHSQTS